MSRRTLQLAAALYCLLAPLALAANSREWTPAKLVQRLNRAAAHFRSLTASLSYTKYTAVVEDKSTEKGELTVNPNGHILIEVKHPEPKEVLFTGDKARIYYPKMSQIQEFDLSKHRALVEQFLLLGFGTPGEQLQDAYLISVLGVQQLNDRRVLQVELTPKDGRIRQQVQKIHLWLDLDSWVPVQQKFFELGGDYLLARYSDIQVNVPVPRSKARLSAPRDTTVVKPRADF